MSEEEKPVIEIDPVPPEHTYLKPKKKPRGRPRKSSFHKRERAFGHRVYIPKDEALEYKVKVLDLIAKGQAKSPTDAARQLDLTPTMVYWWLKDDPDFKELVNLAREVFADDLEVKLREHANFIPQMMVLKAYRPMFRDTYKMEVRSDALEKLLAELKSAGKPAETKKEK